MCTCDRVSPSQEPHEIWKQFEKGRWQFGKWSAECVSHEDKEKNKSKQDKTAASFSVCCDFCRALAGENACRKQNTAVKFPEDFCLSAASFSFAFWKAVEEKLFPKWIVQDSHLSFQYCLVLVSFLIFPWSQWTNQKPDLRSRLFWILSTANIICTKYFYKMAQVTY